MCDQDQLIEMGKSGLSRREFGAMGAMAALAACASVEAEAQEGGLTETDVTFAAPGGTMDAVFIHPAAGKHPAVILWPDIAGIREAKKIMARRLAAAGYSVLVPNPYYRSLPGPQFADFDAWRSGGGMQKVGPWMAQNTPAAVAETTKAVVAWLDGQAPVDTAKGVGVQGYCMTGSWTIRGAAAVPERIKGAASFHGGNLVNDTPESPHNLFDDAADDAGFLIAIARDDDERAPGDKDALRAAATAAGADVEIEVYDADHGWTVPDSPVYNQAEADRAWARLLNLYKTHL